MGNIIKKAKQNPIFVLLLLLVFVALVFNIMINNFIQSPKVELPKDALVDEELLGDVSYGTNPEADVNIIEFGDFECGACGQQYPEIAKVLDAFPKEVNYVFKHFPIESLHPYSQIAAEASECARDQGKFMIYHNILYENTGKIDDEMLVKVAESLDLDMDKFNRCFRQHLKSDRVAEDFKIGWAAGVKGTPTIFVNGRKLQGARSFEELKLIINQEILSEKK